MAGRTSGDEDDRLHQFRSVVTMSADDLEQWLETEESRSVGWVRPGETESVGRQAGRQIVRILRTSPDDLSPDDRALMRKAVGFVRRHRAQGGPLFSKRESRWRWSLMNWGHDPLSGPDDSEALEDLFPSSPSRRRR